jgi:hypothetical protein
MYEYAISAGEGTLIKHGTVKWLALQSELSKAIKTGRTMIFQKV